MQIFPRLKTFLFTSDDESRQRKVLGAVECSAATSRGHDGVTVIVVGEAS